ncbi:hypothetical protein [Commensalibacter melissae]|uniref:hypothetical protein n=1 Tax=Commensalibacter melissae TaxID=2070537 RepID=UPI0012D86DC9|nr:hypothetical protein [Commensalibacter melissae]MUG77242.1 hypothetical protein [Commensalibacter melissae]
MFVNCYVKKFDEVNVEIKNDYSLSFEKEYNDNIKNIVRWLIKNKNKVTVNQIVDNFFNETKYEVFLSHSHADTNKVVNLARILEKNYKCKVFIDSIFWANIYDLLKEFDNIYSKVNDNDNYDYQKRNFTTSNLFIILNTALHTMIEMSDYFFFLETKQSTKEDSSLISPWIFSELSFATQVRRREPEDKFFENYLPNQKQKALESRASLESLDELNFIYKIPKLDYVLSSEEFSKLINKN